MVALTEREQRGREIAARFKIQQTGEYWIVSSQSGQGKYVVHRTATDEHCSCDDHQITDEPCKHIFAVRYVENNNGKQLTLFDDSLPDDEQPKPTKRKTYRQDWANYNRSQIAEKHLFQKLLHDLCSVIPEPPHEGRGRKPIPLADQIFAAVFKVYVGFSSRRFSGDLADGQEKGWISRAPHFNSVQRVFDAETTEAWLRNLIARVSRGANIEPAMGACVVPPLRVVGSHSFFDKPYKGKAIGLVPKRMLLVRVARSKRPSVAFSKPR